MPSTTTYLGITHVEENQNQKEVTVNEALNILDGRLGGVYTEDLAGDSGDVTPDEDTMKQRALIKTTGAMSAAVNLILPTSFSTFYWIVHNATGFDLTIKTSGGSGPTISPGEAQIVFADGTDVLAIGASGGGGASEATPKSTEFLTGSGGTSVVSLANNVTPSSVEIYANGIRMRQGSGRDYQVTESVPASGNYDEITPEYNDAFPTGTPLEILYYIA